MASCYKLSIFALYLGVFCSTYTDYYADYYAGDV